MLLALSFLFVLISPGGAFRRTLRRLSAAVLLFPSLFFLSLGIFLGAVWAGISWGCYWSWDPKETCALITLLVYALPAHGKMFPFLIAAKNKKNTVFGGYIL